MQHEDSSGSWSKQAETARSKQTEIELPPETPPKRPGRGERFGSDAARMMFTAALELTEADLHELVQELAAYLAVPEVRASPHKSRVARAVAALREAEALKREQGDGSPLSVETYRRLRTQHPDHGWPPDGSIRRWLGGSWNDALGRARLEAAPDGDALVRQFGQRFVWEEAGAAICAAAEDLFGPDDRAAAFGLAISDYMGWVQRPDVRARPGRRPASVQPFNRFGGWDAAKRAALLGEDPPCGLSKTVVTPTKGFRYSDEEIAEAIQRVGDRVARVPRLADYKRHREAIFGEDHAAGRDPQPLPCVAVILARYPGWDAALAATGLRPFQPPRTGPLRSRASPDWHHPSRIPDEEILAGLREAYEALGHPFRVTAYTDYVRRQGGRTREGGRLAHYQSIYLRFGSFGEGCARAGIPREVKASGPASRGGGSGGERDR